MWRALCSERLVTGAGGCVPRPAPRPPPSPASPAKPRTPCPAPRPPPSPASPAQPRAPPRLAPRPLPSPTSLPWLLTESCDQVLCRFVFRRTKIKCKLKFFSIFLNKKLKKETPIPALSTRITKTGSKKSPRQASGSGFWPAVGRDTFPEGASGGRAARGQASSRPARHTFPPSTVPVGSQHKLLPSAPGNLGVERQFLFTHRERY